MTLREMLYFSGSVLGPALLAQAMAELMAEVTRQPQRPSHRPAPDAVDLLLAQALPDGLDL